MKSLFMTAIILFIIGTVLAAVTPVFSLLLLGRLIQGVGTGIALPLMFNITMEQVPEEKLGVMMGTASHHCHGAGSRSFSWRIYR